MKMHRGELWASRKAIIAAFGLPSGGQWHIRLSTYKSTSAGMREKYRFGVFKGYEPNPITVPHEVVIIPAEGVFNLPEWAEVPWSWVSQSKVAGKHIRVRLERYKMPRKPKQKLPKAEKAEKKPSHWETWEKANKKAFKRMNRSKKYK